jgi:hypothetical protein
VLPDGVVRCYLFSLFSVVVSWLETVGPPVGSGLAEREVWARQGLDRPGLERHRGGRPRWRSLSRWAGVISAWWPGSAVSGRSWRERASSLVAGFVAEGFGGGREAVLARALLGHVGREAAM